MRVAVTGAGGQTGGHVFRKLLARPETFSPIGIVRTDESREGLLTSSNAALEQVLVADITAAGAVTELSAIFAGCVALVIATSAKVKPLGGTNPVTGRPNLGFPDGQPYMVDWLGQKKQIDAAKLAGIKHVVVCSSMGGTNAEHMLNRFGRTPNAKTGGGILIWKRKAEKYLIDSGLTYTIVHPGGLLNEAGGQRQLVVGLDDHMLTGQSRSIPREDVAEVLVNSLIHEEYVNRSFDLVSKPDSGVSVRTDYATLLEPLCGANCDYNLGMLPSEAEEKVEAEALSRL